MLIALAAIVTGSQQLLLLPKEKSEDRREVAATAPSLPQQVVLKPVDRIDSEMEESQRQHLKAVVHRICDTDDDHPKFIHVFALQVPIMLLAISVLAFLAAMCSIVFGPLAYQPVWDDNARVCRLLCPLTVECELINIDCCSFHHSQRFMPRHFLRYVVHHAQTFQPTAQRGRVVGTGLVEEHRHLEERDYTCSNGTSAIEYQASNPYPYHLYLHLRPVLLVHFDNSAITISRS